MSIKAVRMFLFTKRKLSIKHLLYLFSLIEQFGLEIPLDMTAYSFDFDSHTH